MPKAWTDKDDRQYEHIEQAQRERGVPAERAKEIAARTVNKQRREDGRTDNRRTSGTGDPNAPYEDRTKAELYNRAKEMGIEGRSQMDKAELVRALRKAS